MGLPDSTVHGVFQARILKWVAISYLGDLPNPGIKPTSHVFFIGRQILYNWATWAYPLKLRVFQLLENISTEIMLPIKLCYIERHEALGAKAEGRPKSCLVCGLVLILCLAQIQQYMFLQTQDALMKSWKLCLSFLNIVYMCSYLVCFTPLAIPTDMH